MDLEKTISSQEEEVVDLLDVVQTQETVLVKSQLFSSSDRNTDNVTPCLSEDKITTPLAKGDNFESEFITHPSDSPVPPDKSVCPELYERVLLLEKTVHILEEKINRLSQGKEPDSSPSKLPEDDSIMELSQNDISEPSPVPDSLVSSQYDQLVSRIEKCEKDIQGMEATIVRSAVKAAVKTITDEISGLKKEFLIKF